MINKKIYKNFNNCDNCYEDKNFIRQDRSKFIDPRWESHIEYIYCYSCDRESELS